MQKIKLLALDFDGVLTDDHVYVDEFGFESVCCSREDSYGLYLLKKNTDIEVIVISKEKNNVVKKRCEKLRVLCLSGIDDKFTALKKEVEKRNLKLEDVCYVGNDLNDLECIKAVGLGVAVANATDEVKPFAKYVTKKRGGNGAVREVIEKIISQKCKEELV